MTFDSYLDVSDVLSPQNLTTPTLTLTCHDISILFEPILVIFCVDKMVGLMTLMKMTKKLYVINFDLHMYKLLRTMSRCSVPNSPGT